MPIATRASCARCKRPNVVTYSVPEDIKRLVLLNRWKGGMVCPSCFDQIAEAAGIAYTFEDVEAISWSDRGTGTVRDRSKRRQ